MNQDQPSPENPGQRAGNAVDPRQLAQIEQRLKKLRPRSAELDIEAIVRSAVSEPTVVLAERESPGRRRRSYRWIGTIAGAWSCGVIVGALVAFGLLRADRMSEATPERVASEGELRPQVTGPGTSIDDTQMERREGTLESVPAWARPQSLVSVVLLEPYSWRVQGDEWPMLRAGSFDRLRAAPGSWRSRYLTGAMSQPRAETQDSGNAARQATGSAPLPSITREQLLRELLGSSPESIL